MGNVNSTILVTGGAGFIGSTLVRQLLARDRRTVVTLDKFTYAGHRASLGEILNNPGHILVEGDITDAQLLDTILQEHRPAAIIHLAAETHVDRSIQSPQPFAVTNVLGTCTLLDAATRFWKNTDEDLRDSFRFLHVSTDEVFGSATPDMTFDEQSPLAPNSPYAASKAAAEHFVRAFSNTYQLPTLIVNPGNNYGPRQHPEKLIPKMILAAAEGQNLPLFGDGLHQRDWLHVDDCCRAIRRVLDCAPLGSRYVIGTGHPITNLSVVESICDLVGVVLGDGKARLQLIRHVEDRPGHDRRYALDAARAQDDLDWQPQIDFRVGLYETVAWYLENSQWVAMLMAERGRGV